MIAMKRTFISILAAALTVLPAIASTVKSDVTEDGTALQEDTKKKKEVTYNEKGEIIKT